MVVRRVLRFVFLALAAGGVSTAAAEEQGLLDRCWTPQVLAGTAAELKALRSHTKLDLTALKQEPLRYV